jgi:hypothetical protein
MVGHDMLSSSCLGAQLPLARSRASSGRRPGRQSCRRIFPCALFASLLVADAGMADQLSPESSLITDSAYADLTYRASLYHYFQRDFLAAMNGLERASGMAAQTELSHKQDILQGAIYLALGLESESEAVLKAAVVSSAYASERNAAWFYLGKLAYRDGDLPRAARILGRIEGDVPTELRAELGSLQINLAIVEGDLDSAEALLKGQAKAGIWRRYGSFNVGTALLKRGDSERGISLLDRLIALRASSDEERALRDRALTAAAYGSLEQQDFSRAEAYFERIPLNSSQVDRALLGYGLAQSQQSGYREALVPWLELAAMRPLGPAVQEALLAVPYAYEQLGESGEAQASFGYADEVVTSELDRLTDLTMVVAQSGVPGAFRSGRTPGDEAQWHHLIEVLSGEYFQRYRQQQHDLRLLKQSVAEQRHKLAIYRDMLETRRQQRVTAAGVATRDIDKRLAYLHSRRDALVEAVAEAIDKNQWMAFSDSRSWSYWRQLGRAEQRVTRLADGGHATGGSADRLRRISGILQWQASHQQRMWREQAQLSIVGLDGSIGWAERSHAKLLQLAADQSPDAAALVRLAPLEDRAARQIQAVSMAEVQAEETFRSYVMDTLSTEKARLRRYQAEIRIARARLLDEAIL